MKTSDIVSMGSRNLLRRKTRTLLTIVGVLVGATAIVLMISIALGMNASLEASIARMGDLTIIELTQYTGRQENNEYQQYENKLNDEVLTQIRQLDGVLAVTPILNIWNYFSVYVNGKYKAEYMELYGVDPSFLPYMGIELAKGEMPGVDDKNFILLGVEAEYRFQRIGKQIMNSYKEYYYSDGTRKPPKVDFSIPVIMYMQGYQDQYSGYWNDKGEYVQNTSTRKQKFAKYYFEKVSVMSDKSKDPYASWATYVHIDTVKALQTEINKSLKRKDNSVDNYSWIKIKTKDIAAAEAVQKVLTEDMGLTLSSYSLSETRKEMQSQQATLQMMLGIIGAVSLLVAAIGIMNTMYMSIYERTKEIGVMKVLGCPLGGIQSMFLFEAGMIGFFGGIAGIGVSKLASYIMNNVPFLYNALSKMGDNTPTYYYYSVAEEAEKVPVSIIPLWLIGLTILFATIIGLFAGFLPARRATKISALEAIRNE